MFLYQPTSGYCYNSDSIFLYDFISNFKPKGSLLDVGCGVGVLSILLKRDFEINTSIIDIQESMLKYAQHNFDLNGFDVDAYLGDFNTMLTEDRYDFIISNPPFYDTQVIKSKNRHLNIARYADHLPVDSFIKRVKRYLKPKGWFIFCYDAKQIDNLLKVLKEQQINPEKIQFVHSKIDRDAKLVMIAARNNSKSTTQILPPFITFDKNNNYLTKAQNAFNKADLYSIKGDLV